MDLAQQLVEFATAVVVCANSVLLALNAFQLRRIHRFQRDSQKVLRRRAPRGATLIEPP